MTTTIFDLGLSLPNSYPTVKKLEEKCLCMENIHILYLSRLGDLLCCETCSAVYHLGCVDPPLAEVPEDDWHCSICVAHMVNV